MEVKASEDLRASLPRPRGTLLVVSVQQNNEKRRLHDVLSLFKNM